MKAILSGWSNQQLGAEACMIGRLALRIAIVRQFSGVHERIPVATGRRRMSMSETTSLVSEAWGARVDG